MNIPDFYIEPANYETDFDDLRFVRQTVFVDEQQIPVELEFDELDRSCQHVLARDLERKPIGTGRLAPEGKIGRMAVLPEWRGQGVGESLLHALIEKARSQGLTQVSASVQVSALGFYEKSGFSGHGEIFDEAGIPHRAMQMELEPRAKSQRSSPRPRPSSVVAERLDSVESTLAATVQLINDSRRQLYLFSRDLEFSLYGQGEIVEAFKQFALRRNGGSVQIVIQDPAALKGRTHPLLELAQKLPSHFLLRTPAEEEDQQYASAFFANDRDGYLFRLLGNRFEGHWSPRLPAQNRLLQEKFERVWQRSLPCSEFRALGI